MINDLNAGETVMWKYVDDTTISEVIAKGQESWIQQMVDDLAIQARDGFQLRWMVPVSSTFQDLKFDGSL